MGTWQLYSLVVQSIIADSIESIILGHYHSDCLYRACWLMNKTCQSNHGHASNWSILPFCCMVVPQLLPKLQREKNLNMSPPFKPVGSESKWNISDWGLRWVIEMPCPASELWRMFILNTSHPLWTMECHFLTRILSQQILLKTRRIAR